MPDPTMILIIIATIAAMRPFFELPDSRAKAAALKRAGYKSNAKQGCLYLLLVPIMLGLWWWYALATDQVMLGVIPSIGFACTVLALSVEHFASREETRA